jgi:putative heme-binding domain-containing protein
VISEQFQNYNVTIKDDDNVIGRIVDENDVRIVVQPNPLANERVEIKKSDVIQRQPSKVSPMPEGLVNQLTKEEILDLIAYIESTGKEKASNFSGTKTNGANANLTGQVKPTEPGR